MTSGLSIYRRQNASFEYNIEFYSLHIAAIMFQLEPFSSLILTIKIFSYFRKMAYAKKTERHSDRQ